MSDSRGNNDMTNQGNCYESYGEYLNRAAGACEAGDLVLGMHLYLAAYERAVTDPDIPDGMAISGLREAWNLACNLKERSIAEYVFEKLEPFLTGEEIAQCANKLQSLALDRLEEYGFSREELQDMAELITQDFMDGESSVVKVESISIPGLASAMGGATAVGEAIEAEEDAGSAEAAESFGEADSVDSAEDDDSPEYDETSEWLKDSDESEGDHDESLSQARAEGKPGHVGIGSAAADFNPYDLYSTSSVGTSYHVATTEGSGSYVFTRDTDRATELERVREAAGRDDANRDSEDDGRVSDAGDLPSRDLAPAQLASVRNAVSQDGAAQTQKAAAQQGAALAGADAGQIAKQGASADEPGRAATPQAVAQKPGNAEVPSAPQVQAPGAHKFSYRELAGYSEAIASVRELGVGLQRDGSFRNFIQMMNSRHGLDRMPALDTLLFRAPVIEDATRFVDATIGEIGLPVLRLSMEEGFQGAPVLCVTTFGDSRPRMNHAQNRFDGPAILVLDDMDTWVMPQAPENVEGIVSFVMANMSRGAREAINMIRSAVEDPDVFVLATASDAADIDPFFFDILEPITFIDIDNPTESERNDIWREIMRDHPSMRTVDRSLLVKYSAGMPRYDIYMAARAAVEEAYKAGLVRRMYLPVTLPNILDKIAACQPLDSDEYQAIEDELVRSFKDELENLEDLIDGPSA